MRILVLGGSGMLGHKCCQVLAERHEVWTTIRSEPFVFGRYDLVGENHVLGPIDVTSLEVVSTQMEIIRPEAVVNAVGLVKQRPEASDPILAITVNSLLPHHVSKLCGRVGSRLIHISTDCVFSGAKGGYVESDVPDAADLYGRTKLLGEVGEEGSITLRTSIIGREISSANGLVEWFLANRGGSVRGYRRSIFSGLPTLVLARIVADVIENYGDLSGLWQVSAAPITKLRLLELINAAYSAGVEIEPVDGEMINRSLDSSRFRAATGFDPPSWEVLIQEMVADKTPYESWRSEL